MTSSVVCQMSSWLVSILFSQIFDLKHGKTLRKLGKRPIFVKIYACFHKVVGNLVYGKAVWRLLHYVRDGKGQLFS